jgi:hypothetical protein
MGGHVLRVHPEMAPKALAEIRAKPEIMASIRAQHAATPELWSRLLEALEGKA